MGHNKARVRTTVSASQSTLVSRALLWFVREYRCERGGGGYLALSLAPSPAVPLALALVAFDATLFRCDLDPWLEVFHGVPLVIGGVLRVGFLGKGHDPRHVFQVLLVIVAPAVGRSCGPSHKAADR
jgi:hypothetical protein